MTRTTRQVRFEIIFFCRPNTFSRCPGHSHIPRVFKDSPRRSTGRKSEGKEGEKEEGEIRGGGEPREEGTERRQSGSPKAVILRALTYEY